MLTEELSVALPVVLVVGLAYASWEDWRRREVSDTIWQALAVIGALGGVGLLAGFGPVPLVSWAAVSLLVIEHMFPWDVRLERWNEAAPGYVELGLYAAVIALIVLLVVEGGIGPAGVPVDAIAVLASVLLARTLFEIGVLYGGADAKALMVSGLLVPLFASPLLPVPETARLLLTYYPFALNLLMDAALLALAIPVALAVRNLRRGDFELPRGFTSYVLPVHRLTEEYVWLKDPLLHPEAEDANSAEEDSALRARQRADLESRGVTEVWVTPQLPFVILLAAGAVSALLVGNIIFDLAAFL